MDTGARHARGGTRHEVRPAPAPAPASTPPTPPTPPSPSSPAPIRKPLPRTVFVDHGTNAEMRWDGPSQGPGGTCPERLFVRNHTSTPLIDPTTYRLTIHGDGLRQPREERDALHLSLADLQRLPVTTTTAALECTGNGRSYFASQQGQPAPGTPWRMGAVGVVTWQGVRLGDLLEEIGVRRDAVDVMATGLDDPYVDSGGDHGHVRRPLPIAKAMDDAILAWSMNGHPLPADHGFPLRLVVPGWVGVASIKWLGSLRVSTTEQTSPWSTYWYRLTGGDHPADSPPLTLSPVRSAWELAEGAILSRNRGEILRGRSWSGAGKIARVEVSIDAGRTWVDAQLRDVTRAWAQWIYHWPGGEPGVHVLMARATDSEGRVQPLATPPNAQGYLFDAVVRHPVTVA